MTEPRWVPGYGTNGFADHTLSDALDVMQGCGYGAVALTLGHPHFDPFAVDWEDAATSLAEDLRHRGLRVVVETGARYLLDPWVKHRPTLVDIDADARRAFLRRAVQIAAILDADCVSLWSGVLPADVTAETGWALLIERLGSLARFAADRGVRIAIEPEPGMLVETVADALRLRADLGDPDNVGITVDLGHCVAVEPDGVVRALHRAGPLLWNVQVDDMLPGIHEHLELGTGALDLEAAIEALDAIGYEGVAAVELPRHSFDAPRLARQSIDAIRAAVPRRADPWTIEAVAAVVEDRSRVHRLFAEAGRAVGRQPLDPRDDPGFAVTADDAARAALIVALSSGAEPAAERVRTLYREGDDAERRGVLRGLNALAAGHDPLDSEWRRIGREIVDDALRTNDRRLVAAAMGDFAAAELDAHSWRHGVLKLVFMDVPLAVVSGLERRRDDELSAMAARFAEERRAAGRSIPSDLDLLVLASQER
ncbi:EboA domain-containing protein [Microbacterium rhizomatis]|uniref:Sugar phosphate isomerase/epimerase n=1 Tax=Microbacterium rhizomatis TaxID=1631477 RepID=A0A5J5J334_9MICO|nr:EboA domain-containing protein [Microbacterium rhizomatis]KAA9107618.1 sugar phosphate isomerase/epimerase [Microbacterium rhizomatis]